MADSASRRRSTHNEPAINTARPWQVLKKRRRELIAASVLLAAWLVFLVAMAVYN